MNKLLARHSDLLLALFVLAVAAMLLVPLPTPLLDFLLVINLAASLLLLLVGLYMPNALAMSAFPALLLLTTLFRLSLNVASTRLILSQGDAGEVIQAFGRLLVQGEVVVGLIIFIIITIVNFVVIARGSSRVSEVAARFTLDALPGKQMAIDADLRSGLLTPEEAQAKREDLRTESQLYGAMDGSMKFVQGDAVAGLFIIATNLVGGLYVGISQGMGFRDAIDTYLILTVGDGLVSQIPALLISICAGIVVTRVVSGDSKTLSSDLGSQLFSNPTALVVTGGVLTVVGLVSGLPWVPFVLVGTGLMGTAYLVQRNVRAQLIEGGSAFRGAGPLLSLPGPGVGLLSSAEDGADGTDAVVCLDPGIQWRAYRANREAIHQVWSRVQRSFHERTGLRFPRLRVEVGESLHPGAFEVRLGIVSALKGSMPADAWMVLIHPGEAKLLGIEVCEEYSHPSAECAGVWARRSPALEQVLRAGDIPWFEPIEVIALELAHFLVRNPQYGLSVTDLYRQLKQTEKRHPGLVSEAFAKAAASVPRLAEVVYGLVRAGLNVKDTRTTLESVATYCAMEGHALSDEDGVDIAEVVQFIRRSRHRELLQRSLNGRGSMAILTLDESTVEIINRVEEVAAAEGGGIGLSAVELERLRVALEREVQPIRLRGIAPVTLLAPKEIRGKIESLLVLCGLSLPVVSADELDPQIPLEPAGVWSVEAVP